MMEIVGLIQAEGNPDNIDRSLSSSTAGMIDVGQKLPQTRSEELARPADMTPFLDRIETAKSPRIIRCHLQPHVLPTDLFKRAKVGYYFLGCKYRPRTNSLKLSWCIRTGTAPKWGAGGNWQGAIAPIICLFYFIFLSTQWSVMYVNDNNPTPL